MDEKHEKTDEDTNKTDKCNCEDTWNPKQNLIFFLFGPSSRIV